MAGEEKIQTLNSTRFSRDVLCALEASQRDERLRELEKLIDARLTRHSQFSDFQAELYRVIDELKVLGHVLYSWEYSGDIEFWGGDYTKKDAEYELLLRSEFPRGVQLAWKDPDALP